MLINLKKIIFNNYNIKLYSMILGYSVWLMLSQTHTVEQIITAPIYFYDIPGNLEIEAPKTVTVHISGKRADFNMLNTEQLALHINAQELHTGSNVICVSAEKLFLPRRLNLVDYCPSHVIVSVQHKKESSC